MNGDEYPEVIELPVRLRRARSTGKLPEIELSVQHPSVECYCCGHRLCRDCGRCHQAGCTWARVVCSTAQERLMRRGRRIPKDDPPHQRRKLFGLF